MPDGQYVYIRKFTKCFLIFENPFIILKVSFLFSSTPFLFIRAVLKLLLEYLGTRFYRFLIFAPLLTLNGVTYLLLLTFIMISILDTLLKCFGG